MKKMLLLLCLVLVPAVSFAQPSIQFEREKHDFGKVYSSASLEYGFEFINAGTEELVIDRLVPS